MLLLAMALLFPSSVYLADLRQLNLDGFAWLCFAPHPTAPIQQQDTSTIGYNFPKKWD
jgi:hypothetical protein